MIQVLKQDDAFFYINPAVSDLVFKYPLKT